jgi:hypothetical protein
MEIIMRLLIITCCIFASASSSFAAPINYNNDKYQERIIPRSQYTSGTAKEKTNGQITKKKPSRFFNSKDHELNIGLKTGYNSSELKWNIAGNTAGTSPNILSELKWQNIGAYKVEPKIEYTQKNGYLKGLNLQASVNKSITFTGDNQDSDYACDNRDCEFSRSNNSSDAGHSEGFSASIGYAFDFADDRKKTVARLTTLVGYSIQNQKFAMRDGFQTWPATGSFANLRSSYDMEWKAPFVGMELTGYFKNVHQLKIRAQYSKGSYNGTGNWNLRADFMHPNSFEHDADGNGFLFGAEYAWEFYPQLQFTLSSNYNYFKTDKGNDITFFSDGSVGQTRLNRVEWQSLDYMAGLNYRF